MTNVEELKGLLERATKGPWKQDGVYLFEDDATGRVIADFRRSNSRSIDEARANATLAMAAVNALPALLEERDRLREACKKTLTCGLDSSVRELVASALRGERTP